MPGTRLGALHLLSHLFLKTTLTQAATDFANNQTEARRGHTLGPVYAGVSGQDSDSCPKPLPGYFKQQRQGSIVQPKVCNPSTSVYWLAV